MPRAFIQQRRLHWGEADPAGTIYAPQAIDFAIQAIEAVWIEATGLSFQASHARFGKAAPWVHTSCEFERPLRAGDPFTLGITLEKMGGSSFVWRGEATRPDGVVLFRLKLVSVLIDLATDKACAIPDDMRSSLMPYLA